MERWYAFKAYNRLAAFGYGTAAEAERYADHLNANRDINHFAAVVLSDTEVAELRLADNDLGIALSVALHDIEAG